MLKVTGRGSITTCDGIARRDFLQVGTLGTIGLTLSKFAALQSLGATASGKDDKSCIMIFNLGAPSQLDTFDMKPNAPSEIRGPFKPIKTNSPDIQISEIWMSGLLVLIGLNGPRISEGALGFMSKVSNWLGAPRLKIMMHDLSSLPEAVAPRDCSAANFERVRPMVPRVPTWRKSRRAIPSQVVMEPLPVTLSMASCVQNLAPVDSFERKI